MAQVRVTPRRRFAQFLIFSPAAVEIDDTPVGRVRWGKPETFTVPAGRHRLTVSFPYLGKARTGVASVELDLAEGQTVEATYRSPWIVTSHGSIQLT